MDLTTDARLLGPMNTTVFEDPRKGGLPAVIPAEDFGTRFSRKFMAKRTRHLSVLQGAVDLVDVTIAQAQVMAGVPMLDMAAKVIDERVVPAYARAQLQGDSREIDEMLEQGHRRPNPANGPRCSTGALAFDTLCLMQTNRWFRENVMRALVLRRLKARGVDGATWARTVRLPFSPALQSLLGEDVLLRDASSARSGAVYARWAVELPRVNLRADHSGSAPSPAEGPPFDCWESRPVAATGEKPYTERDTAFCALWPQVDDGTLDTLSFPFDMNTLVRERLALQRDLEVMCMDLPEYSELACGWARATVPTNLAARP